MPPSDSVGRSTSCVRDDWPWPPVNQHPRAWQELLIGEDVRAQDVDLPTGISEEGTDPPRHNLEGTLSGRPVCLPIVPRDDQEQMVRIRRQMRLPKVLEIVIVRGGSPSLDLSDHPAPGPQSEEEVRSSLSHEAALGSKHHLFTEPQFET